MAAIRIIYVLAVLLLIYPAARGLQDGDAKADDDDTLVITTVLFPPYTTYDNDSETFDGFVPALLKELCAGKYLSCDYKLQLVADGMWGKRADDGTWSGMIGEVHHGDAEVAAAPISVTPKRRMVVDFTETFGDNSLTLLLRKDLDPPIEKFTELIDSEDVRFGCIDGGSVKQRLQQSPNDPFPRLWAKMSKIDEKRDSVFVANMADGVDKVLDEEAKYVLIGEKDILEYEAKKHCSLETKDKFLEDKGYAFAVQKDSPLKENLNAGITKLIENGKMKELRDAWWDVPCGGSRGASSVFILALGVLSAWLVSRK